MTEEVTLEISDGMIDLGFAREKGFDAAKLGTCLQCGTCSSSCPTYFAMDVPPRKLWRMVSLGLKEEIARSSTFWLCTACHSCTVRCPRGIPVSESMRQIREWVIHDGVQETPRALSMMSEMIVELSSPYRIPIRHARTKLSQCTGKLGTSGLTWIWAVDFADRDKSNSKGRTPNRANRESMV